MVYTHGDNYNIACPNCGEINHYVGHGVCMELGKVYIITKPCFSCKKMIEYTLNYEIKVLASYDEDTQ